MNRLFVVLTVVAIASLPVGASRADGLIVQLPKDGAWAAFDMHQVTRLADRNTGDKLAEDNVSDSSLRVSSVGQATVEGKPCRWIEYKILETGDGMMHSIICKVLIPELPGPLQDSKKLDSKLIEGNAGKLTCKGISGTTSWKDETGRAIKTAHELRLHDKSPFGVAFQELSTEVGDPMVRMTIKTTSTLSESGTNAKSELPDQN